MLAVVLCCVVLSATVGVVQGGYQYRSELQRFVAQKKVIANWEEAKQICEREGAVLASPINVELFKYMSLVIGVNNHTTAYFIGTKARHNYSESYKEFVSEEGILVDDMPDDVINVIEHLDPIHGDCLSMDRHGIRVVPCHSRLPYICYKRMTESSIWSINSIIQSTTATTVSTAPTTVATAPTNVVTAPTTVSTAPTTVSTAPTTVATAPTTVATAPTTVATAPTTETTTKSTTTTERAVSVELGICGVPGYTYYPTVGACYRHHRDPNTWEDAHRTCVSEGGDLVVINSQQELEIVHNILTPLTYLPYHYIIWTGFKDQSGHGDWWTVHGERYDQLYNVDSSNAPTRSDNFKCASVTMDGRFEYPSCYTAYYYICEKRV